MKRVTPETLAAALATLNGGAPVEVRPASVSIDGSELDLHHKAVAAAIYAALPDEPDALREALEGLVNTVQRDAGTFPWNPDIEDALDIARTALAASAAGKGGER